MISNFEIRPESSSAHEAQRIQLAFPVGRGAATDIHLNVDPWFDRFGGAGDVEADFGRLALAAFLVDRKVPLPAHLTRSLNILVQMIDPDPWVDVAVQVNALLEWLTGDVWNVNFTREDSDARPIASLTESQADTVTLFSGGLDSFAGAAIAEDSSPGDRLYLSHADDPITRGAQRRVARWFRARCIQLPIVEVDFRTKGPNRQRRSRALMFMGLAAALASSSGARQVEVPENGFTSLNPPLRPNRGGAMSTRSTHPLTLKRLNDILDKVGSSVSIANRHDHQTKGELVRSFVELGLADSETGIAETFSCGKPDTRFFGGNPSHNCGLDVACVTRRAAIATAGVADLTPYVVDEISGSSLEDFLKVRRDDIMAIQIACLRDFTLADVLSHGGLPSDWDPADAVDLANRGLDELRQIQLQ